MYAVEEQIRKTTQEVEEDNDMEGEESAASKVSMEPEEEQELLSSKCTKITQQEEEDDDRQADKEEEEEGATPKSSMEPEIFKQMSIVDDEEQASQQEQGATPKSSMDPEVLKQMSIIAKYSFRNSDEEISDDEQGSEEDAPPQVEEEYDQEEELEIIMKQMTGSITKLPLEIIFNILSRLPIKTLSQSCRWVSKSWFKIIRHPRFAQTQHAKALKSFSPCVTYWELRTKSFWLVNHEVFDAHGNSTRVYDPKIEGFGWAFDVVGACNGLICMEPDPHCYKPAPYFVFNPITRESIKLPKSPNYKIAPRKSGFGFNPVTNEYKVVRILKTHEVEIYTLGSSGWRRICDVPYDVIDEAMFVNGALHWCAYNQCKTGIAIVALDMATEEFQEIPPPPCVVPGKRIVSRTVGVLGGCLSFTDDCFDDHIGNFAEHVEIWVMKSYGVPGSWSKEYVIRRKEFRYGGADDGYEVVKLENGELLLKHKTKEDCGFELVLSENGELEIKEKPVLYYKNDLLHYYDPKTKVFQPILTHGIPSYVWSLRPLIHVGSLISPKNIGRSRKRVMLI